MGKEIKCCVCDEVICTKDSDFKKNGGITIQLGERLEIYKDFCKSCKELIAREWVEEVLP